MNENTLVRMKNFRHNGKAKNRSIDYECLKEYKAYLLQYNGGNGMIGEHSYLILWNQEEIEERNKDYKVEEFLTNTVLIGSDGADTAYGINLKGEYIEVPFIGMDDDEVEVISHDFDGFIKYLYEK